MPSDRTLVTELATGLGTLGHDDVGSALASRPSEMRNIGDRDWQHLSALWRDGHHVQEFAVGFANGRAFLEAPDALNGRRPRIVEWTGGRRPPGDEVVPSDLRIDHVYLVSCKYLSRILHNPSPARLVEGLLAQSRVESSEDWYVRIAPAEHQRLYSACADAMGDPTMPPHAGDLTREQRRKLAHHLQDRWPEGAEEHYSRMCARVSEKTALVWKERLDERNTEAVLWRLLRIGSAPYFILGTSASGAVRLRIDSPWDWRQSYRLVRFDVAPQPGGQPRVGWEAVYEDRASSTRNVVRGHVEIRWSHGRFGQPPEAKVYLDTPHEDVPGYHLLETRPAPAASQGVLWHTVEPAQYV
jgi:hypothetical protein